jgi:hypothetical protein
MRRIKHPSPAMAVALLALVFAIGGTSYAAAGKKPKKASPLTLAQVEKEIKKLAPTLSVKSAQTAAFATTAGTATSATTADSANNATTATTAITATTAEQASLPTGGSIRGRYVIRFTAAAAADLGGTGIAFGFTLPSAPTPVFVAEGATPPATCPGTPSNPEAQPGFLCVYESTSENDTDVTITNAEALSGSETYGAGIALQSTAAGATVSSGTWAVTP